MKLPTHTNNFHRKSRCFTNRFPVYCDPEYESKVDVSAARSDGTLVSGGLYSWAVLFAGVTSTRLQFLLLRAFPSANKTVQKVRPGRPWKGLPANSLVIERFGLHESDDRKAAEGLIPDLEVGNELRVCGIEISG